MTPHEALALDGITHTFGGHRALDDATCVVARGTIHALLGENGAGKTTLMRIAFGMLRPDAGTIHIDGAPMSLRSSADAITRGIGMVHQHFMLVPAMTVAENVALGTPGPLDLHAVRDRIRAIGAATGLVVDPDARVRDLPVSAQQRVEIVKALARDARTLILDEPTAVLTPEQGDELLRWTRRFADDGGSVVLITHKLREARRHADEITVLRRGRVTQHAMTGAVDDAAIIAAITGGQRLDGDDTPRASISEATSASPSATDTGRATPRPYRHTATSDEAAEIVLALDGATVHDARGLTRLHPTTLAVRRGEILGVIGVEGAGQRELLRLLAGRLAPTAGRATIPAEVGFVPEDRLHDAVIPELTLTENLALAEAGRVHGWLRWSDVADRTAALLTADDVRAGGIDVPMRTLSGGNQQKFVLGRERRRASAALIVENPTRGLDLQATARILEGIRAVATDAAVVFHSTDLEDVLRVATRVVACFDGRVREVPPPADPDDRTPYGRALLGAE
ncbi:MAG: ABC transporter ATP-binding protein [Gemmatimonadota bacterium]